MALKTMMSVALTAAWMLRSARSGSMKRWRRRLIACRACTASALMSGGALVWSDGKEFQLSEGGVVFLPKNVPHGYRITSDTADLLLICTPSGIEGMFRHAGRDLSTPRPDNFHIPPHGLAEAAAAHGPAPGHIILAPPRRVALRPPH